MTLPTSGGISTDMLLAELRVANPGRSYPLGTTDADVLALAGKGAPPVVLPDDFYGKSAAAPAPPPPAPPVTQPMTVQTTNGSGLASSENSSGQVSCQVSAQVSGGRAPITHLWEFTSNPGAFTLSGSNGAAATVSKAYTRYSNGSAEAVLRYTARDSAGAVVVAEPVYANLEWYGDPVER